MKTGGSAIRLGTILLDNWRTKRATKDNKMDNIVT